MPDDIVITQQSWFSRLGDAFKGVFAGLLLVLGGIALLWWNEGRTITTAKALAEGAGLVVSVEAGRVEPGNEGKLVHVFGRAFAGGQLTDPDFPFMAAQALVLQRKVEMFQWQEDQQTKEVKKMGGSVEKQTSYSYQKVWSASLKDSARFHESAEHGNPASMPYAPFTLKASGARLGAFRLPAALLDLPASEALRAPDNAPVSGKLRITAGQMYLGANPDAPEVGDVRIQYAYAPEQEVSVVARQMGDSFGAFSVSGGKRSIQMLKPGLLDAAAMFEAAQSENRILAWIVRVGGTLGLCLGIYLVLRPLSVAGDVIPLIGSMLNAGAGLVAALLGLACGLIVIALAWIAHRPILGALLLVAASSAVVGMRILAKRRDARAAPETGVAVSRMT